MSDARPRFKMYYARTVVRVCRLGEVPAGLRTRKRGVGGREHKEDALRHIERMVRLRGLSVRRLVFMKTCRPQDLYTARALTVVVDGNGVAVIANV